MADKTTKSHRELIDTGRDKRFVERDEKGQFDEVADVGRSLAQDTKQAETKVPPGQGTEAIKNANRRIGNTISGGNSASSAV